VVDGLITLIDHPELPDEELFELIPGPDFLLEEIVEQLGFGSLHHRSGSISVRGIAQIEEIQPGRGRFRRMAIVVTELPYQVNKASWIEKVASWLIRVGLRALLISVKVIAMGCAW